MFKPFLIGIVLIFASCAHSFPQEDDKHLVVHKDDGQSHPAPGYVWSFPEDDKNLEVKWNAGLPYSKEQPNLYTATEEGRWHITPGYILEDPSKITSPDEIKLRWMPGLPFNDNANIIADEKVGFFMPALGYNWVIPGHPEKDFSVKWVPNVSIPPMDANILTSVHEGMFVPRPGYHWADGGTEERPDPSRNMRVGFTNIHAKILLCLDVGRVGEVVQVFQVLQSFSDDLGRVIGHVHMRMHAVEDEKPKATSHGSPPDRSSTSGMGGPSGGSGRDAFGASGGGRDRSGGHGPQSMGAGGHSTDRPSRDRPH